MCWLGGFGSHRLRLSFDIATVSEARIEVVNHCRISNRASGYPDWDMKIIPNMATLSRDSGPGFRTELSLLLWNIIKLKARACQQARHVNREPTKKDSEVNLAKPSSLSATLCIPVTTDNPILATRWISPNASSSYRPSSEDPTSPIIRDDTSLASTIGVGLALCLNDDTRGHADRLPMEP